MLPFPFDRKKQTTRKKPLVVPVSKTLSLTSCRHLGLAFTSLLCACPSQFCHEEAFGRERRHLTFSSLKCPALRKQNQKSYPVLYLLIMKKQEIQSSECTSLKVQAPVCSYSEKLDTVLARCVPTCEVPLFPAQMLDPATPSQAQSSACRQAAGSCGIAHFMSRCRELETTFVSPGTYIWFIQRLPLPALRPVNELPARYDSVHAALHPSPTQAPADGHEVPGLGLLE